MDDPKKKYEEWIKLTQSKDSIELADLFGQLQKKLLAIYTNTIDEEQHEVFINTYYTKIFKRILDRKYDNNSKIYKQFFILLGLTCLLCIKNLKSIFPGYSYILKSMFSAETKAYEILDFDFTFRLLKNNVNEGLRANGIEIEDETFQIVNDIEDNKQIVFKFLINFFGINAGYRSAIDLFENSFINSSVEVKYFRRIIFSVANTIPFLTPASYTELVFPIIKEAEGMFFKSDKTKLIHVNDLKKFLEQISRLKYNPNNVLQAQSSSLGIEIGITIFLFSYIFI